MKAPLRDPWHLRSLFSLALAGRGLARGAQTGLREIRLIDGRESG